MTSPDSSPAPGPATATSAVARAATPATANRHPDGRPPLFTTVVGSYPFPGWLELVSTQLDRLGPADLAEAQDDAVRCAIADQVAAGLDVISDGEQTRLDFNLSFYGHLDGISNEPVTTRHFGPPAHDQRGRHSITGELGASRGLGVVAEYERLARLAPPGQRLKASMPGPYTMAGRLEPSADYPDRWAVTEALVPVVRAELEALADAGCREVCVDEPSMSCYAHKEDPARMVDVFNRTVATVGDRVRLATHLCFGNFKARAIAPREYAPMFPAFCDLTVHEMHLEMASRQFAELEVIAQIPEQIDVVVGVVDVKSYWVEPPEHIRAAVHRCLRHVAPQRLGLSSDCGLSQTARWAASAKLANLVRGVRSVRDELAL